MSITKRGEVKVGVTPCEFCHQKSTIIGPGGLARCSKHPYFRKGANVGAEKPRLGSRKHLASE